MTSPKKAVCLLSGGIDSTTALAIAKNEGFELYALTFRYGQRHIFEVESARTIARQFVVKEHLVLDIDLGVIGGSALTSTIPVPKDRKAEEITRGIPVTYVPARNTIFLSYALAWAEVINAETIFIGVTAVDYSGYPDCRPEYIAAFERMANLATKATTEGKFAIHINTPLINLSKAEIIKKGIELGIDYSITHSCYDPDKEGRACGRCDSCLLRKKGFEEAGIVDPTIY
ncbi:MAG: 7-cyano-7-deazaguanine synthase QueC [Deltaproteobacteria bacterium]|nr:7-cyano-7-deazaguanine synthase QueC [Deltaproteobacteria bacterium]